MMMMRIRSVATFASFATFSRHVVVVVAKTTTTRLSMVPSSTWIRSLSIRGGVDNGNGKAKEDESPQTTFIKRADPAPGSRKSESAQILLVWTTRLD